MLGCGKSGMPARFRRHGRNLAFSCLKCNLQCNLAVVLSRIWLELPRFTHLSAPVHATGTEADLRLWSDGQGVLQAARFRPRWAAR
jgi:hypothetical protein